jgi:ketosteroid isomerase-like protein
MKRATDFSIIGSGTVLLLAACSGQPNSTNSAATDPRPAAMAAVGQAAEKYGKAIVSRNTDAIVANYTVDTWLFPPNAPIAKTAEERRAYWDSQPLIAGASDTVGITAHIEVAQSGELAVEYGGFFQLRTDKTGASMSTPQKYVAAWAKQSDGSWKVIADMWNTDQPTKVAAGSAAKP